MIVFFLLMQIFQTLKRWCILISKLHKNMRGYSAEIYKDKNIDNKCLHGLYSYGKCNSI